MASKQLIVNSGIGVAEKAISKKAAIGSVAASAYRRKANNIFSKIAKKAWLMA